MEHRTIAISRPVGQGQDTAETVERLGWTPFIFHTVELKPFKQQEIRDQIEASFSPGPPDWIVFMSLTGVKLFFDNLTSHSREMISAQSGSRFLAVGPRTKEHLLRYGVEVFVPENYSSAGVDAWFSRLTPEPVRIVLVRSSSADDSLADSLRSRGTTVTTINVYKSAVPTDPHSVFEMLAGLRTGQFVAVLFTSAISVSNFFKIAQTKFQSSELTRLLQRVVVGAIGPVTAEQLRQRGIEPIVPEEYLIEKAVSKLISASP